MFVIPRIIYELWHENKAWVYVLLILSTVIVLTLILTSIGYASTNNQGKRLTCNVCGKGFQWNTMLGEFNGNICNNGSFGDTIEDCGIDSACFKMNNMISVELQDWFKNHTAWLRNNSHHFADHFYYYPGTIRGCIRGFGWLDKCHFFNSSNIWKHESYWHATNMCVCTTDNCN